MDGVVNDYDEKISQKSVLPEGCNDCIDKWMKVKPNFKFVFSSIHIECLD